MTYELLREWPQDSPEWHEARTHSLGASEVAAVLGLSKWQTPLSVYRSKMGVPNEIPEDLAYFGHALEPVIAKWITDKHPEVGPVGDGVSVRSVEHPWLTATPDRTMSLGDDGWIPEGGPWVPIELKTSSAFSKSAWDAGVPDYYKIQSIVQQGILGAPYGWVAVLHGGNAPELYRVPFDAAVWEQIVRLTGEWWEAHVVAQVPPAPTTTAEAVELWPGDPDVTVEGGEDLYELWGVLGQMEAERVDLAQRIDAAKLTLQAAMRDAVALTYEGQELFTWRPRAGSRLVDKKALAADGLLDKYTTTGAPTRVFKRITQKEVDA